MMKIFFLIWCISRATALEKSGRIITNGVGPGESGNESVIELTNVLLPLTYQKVAVLVHDTKEIRQDAQAYMEHLLDLNIEFLLVTFNSSGISPILASSAFKEQFLSQLEWLDSQNTSMSLAPSSFKRGAVFFAILRATRFLPPNSGIIVFTDYKVEDEDLAQLAIKEMNDKRIKLFVIWEGIYPSVSHEEKLLKDTSYLTGGDFLIGNTEGRQSDLYNRFYLTHPNGIVTKSVVAFYTNVKNAQLDFPIESRVNGVHLSVTTPISNLELISPQGSIINVLNKGEVENFAKGSFVIYDENLGQYDIQLNTTKSTTPGLWRLNVKNDVENVQGSNVTISVQSHLNVTTSLTYNLNSGENLDEILRISMSDATSKINSVDLIDQQGFPIKEKLELAQEESANEIDIPVNQLPSKSFYLKISGEDNNGNSFARLSYFDREKISYLVQPLTVDVTAGSELLVMPGRNARILFEVTNNRDQVYFVNFRVQDERSLLKNMQPRSSWLNPKQTIIVTVTVLAPNIGTFRNLVTLTASTSEQVRKSAAMYVTNNRVTDNEQPYMNHRYTSDCTDILIGDCRRGTWVIEVTAADKDSGLLQLTSMPKGLFFPTPYIAGTREPIVGIYGGSCCQPKLQLISIDVNHNRRTYTANAYNTTLSAGSIAAIILGIILFIILIVLIVILARKNCWKSKESVDLPTYRSPTRSQTRF